MHKEFYHDILVIGSGAAGLSLALRLAAHAKVTVLAKADLTETSTLYAQGGVAAVMSDDDSLEAHIKDTLIAGAGLCDQAAVEFTVRHARGAIEWLIDQGVSFSVNEDGGNYHLTREGGHSFRRILHAEDATGIAVETTLASLVRDHPNIELFEHHMAIDLIQHENRCTGAYVLNTLQNRVDTFQAKCVALATGGASKTYLYTSNPDIATGDGLAMAWRLGCPIANLEFNQFHPTCLYHPEARSFLITEALRGEGAILQTTQGERFMPRYDERAELAPRDIVARSIDHVMKTTGEPCVYLDISHRPSDFVKNHFPTIYSRCLNLGIDITRDRIPVVPAAHYTCGGVVTDLRARTEIPGLYAIGEVACTGLHGANRMASNSILECLVFAEAASLDIVQQLDAIARPAKTKPWDESWVINSDEQIVVTHNWQELRRTMWDYVGIVRTDKRLKRAQNRIELLQQEIQEYYANFRVNQDLLELRNLVTVASLIVQSAQERKESRGLHYNVDYPNLVEPRVSPLHA